MADESQLGRAIDASPRATDDTASGWKDQGICGSVDPDLWFPEKGQPTKAAKEICFTCPVQAQCLDYALDEREAFGVWGGMSPADRRWLLKLLGEDVPEDLNEDLDDELADEAVAA